MNLVYGIGWDTGGWRGNKHGFALCSYDTGAKKAVCIKTMRIGMPKEKCFSLKELFGKELEFDTDSKIVVAIDAPLSVPVKYKALLRQPLGKKPYDFTPPENHICNDLGFRETERHLVKAGKLQKGRLPLSGTFSWLGNNMTVALVHCHYWSKEEQGGFSVYPQLEKQTNRMIIETYPALIDEQLVEQSMNALDKTKDENDAMKAAFVALTFGAGDDFLDGVGLCEAPLDEKYREEGWIYYIKS